MEDFLSNIFQRIDILVIVGIILKIVKILYDTVKAKQEHEKHIVELKKNDKQQDKDIAIIKQHIRLS